MTNHLPFDTARDRGPLPLRRTVVEGPWAVFLDSGGQHAGPLDAGRLPASGLPGEVPGAVHHDLHRAGLIPDPFVDDHEDAVAWVSRANWRYHTALPHHALSNAERIDLVFGGLDTAAEIQLGEATIGRTRNMHRSYRFDITSRYLHGDRDLDVRLTSAYIEAEGLRDWTGPRPSAYPEPFNFVRKMACSFGWDWGPTLPGAGIWRPVILETWSTARLARVRPLTDVDTGTGILTLAVDVERTKAGHHAELAVEVTLGEETVAHLALPPGIVDATTTVRIADIEPWQPRGHGEARLYDLSLTLRTRQGVQLDSWKNRIGFRHMRLDRSADAAGSAFTFRLDGKPVQVRGVNWIPGDIFPGLMTRQRYRERLEQAADANCNLVRVWGGGLYETDDFYDVCDELGLMVWQDFPFACAAYPEHTVLRDEIRAEAEQNVARLSRHPSLVLWNGNNECDWLRIAESWVEQPGGNDDWGQRFYHEDLPEIVHRVDPSRPYTPTSPWSGHTGIFPNAQSHGTHHSWNVWNRQDYAHYRDTVPRFVAEFGWQAPPTWRTLRDAVTDEPLLPSSPGVIRHQKAADGMGKLARGLAPHVRERVDFDAWHYLTQWNQVRAVETGILHWRAHWPTCTGTILWQLNDLWPVISWSAVDGTGRPKPLYFALRDIYAPRALTIQPATATDGTDGLAVAALNDTDETWTAQLVVRRVADAGFDNARRVLPLDVAPRSVERIPLPSDLAVFTEPAAEVLVADSGGLRALWYATEPRDSAFVGAQPRIETEQIDGGLHVAVTATTLLRDFLIQPDRLHPAARIDRGFVTLLPGETATFRVTCAEPLHPSSLEIPWAVSYLDGVLRG